MKNKHIKRIIKELDCIEKNTDSTKHSFLALIPFLGVIIILLVIIATKL